MKVWRVISLTLWGIVLTIMLLVSSVYYLLSYTILDQAKATHALQQTTFYTTVRDRLVLPKIQEQVTTGQAQGSILPSKDILTAVDSVFTTDKVQHITDEVVGATYQWLDNRTPDIEFSIPVAQEKQSLTNTLDARVRQNIAALPVCESAADISDDIATATCIPPYASRDTISQEAISELHTQIQSVDDTLTPEQLGMTTKDLGAATNLPDFVGYLWALNLFTLSLALIISLYLLLKRRGTGLITIGSSILVIGIIGLGAYATVHSGNFMSSAEAATDREIINASKLLFEPTLLLAGGVGIGAGIVSIIGGILWYRTRSE